jgi:hypothetical protein
MELVWYRQDREVVLDGLRRRERPDMAATRACGPLDELLALHDELDVFTAVDAFDVARERAGIPDRLLLHTLAALPFVSEGSLSGATDVLFKEPTILLQLGWAPAHIRRGSNRRHRHPKGRQVESLPCHPDTLRDTLGRIAASAWDRAQSSTVTALYDRRLVRGNVYAVDGSGIGDAFRVVALVCVSSERPMIAAWTLLEGAASEKGKEAHVTRALVESVLARGGAGCIRLLLADALYADGPLLAWLKYHQGIDALVALSAERDLYQDLQGLAAARMISWSRHEYVRTVAGHKEVRVVDVAGVGDLTSWQSFREAAQEYEHPEATLWGCLIRQIAPVPKKPEDFALVSTCSWVTGYAALHAYRPRWHIEDDAFRELKEGWAFEKYPWGRNAAIVRGRVSLTCMAFNTTQVYRSRSGGRIAQKAIRRLRREHERSLGPAPAVIYMKGCYGVFALEEVLAVLSVHVHESLLPDIPGGRGPSP